MPETEERERHSSTEIEKRKGISRKGGKKDKILPLQKRLPGRGERNGRRKRVERLRLQSTDIGREGERKERGGLDLVASSEERERERERERGEGGVIP